MAEVLTALTPATNVGRHAKIIPTSGFVVVKSSPLPSLLLSCKRPRLPRSETGRAEAEEAAIEKKMCRRQPSRVIRTSQFSMEAPTLGIKRWSMRERPGLVRAVLQYLADGEPLETVCAAAASGNETLASLFAAAATEQIVEVETLDEISDDQFEERETGRPPGY